MWYKIDVGAPVEVERFGRARYTKNWNTTGRISKMDRLLFIMKGNIRYTVDGTVFSVCKGSCLYIPKGALFASEIEQSCEFCYLHFHAAIDGPFEEEQYTYALARRKKMQDALPPLPFGQFHNCVDHDIWLKQHCDMSDDFENFCVLINKCENSCYLRRPEDKMRVNLRFLRLLAELSDGGRTAETAADIPPILLQLTKYVQKYYTDDITLAGISEEFSLSKQYIARLFRKYLGTTVTKYINDIRLQQSLELLRHSSLNISEIAATLGYHSVYYFCRIFKQTYHMTPTDYIRGKADPDFE